MKRARAADSKGRPTKRQAKTQNFAFKKAMVRAKTDELKNIDVLTTGTITFGQTTANLALLNGVDDGATSLTRVGRKIVITSLAWRWQGSVGPTTTGASGLRLLIVRDSQTNAAAPLATDILQVDAIHSMMNLDNSKRFKVLVDHLVPCVGTSGPQAWNEKGFIQFEKPLKGKPGLEVTFNNASTATVASITTGSIYALFYQNGQLLVASPTSNLYTRCRFIDA
ncbi:hypothetical protein P6U18_22775 [Pseudomonas sp. L01]|nr:hypothetical protein [Pseudomonas sp. L01]